jgi:hypothetical protein
VDTNDVVEQLSSLISKLFAVPGNSKSTGYAIKELEEAVEGE